MNNKERFYVVLALAVVGALAWLETRPSAHTGPVKTGWDDLAPCADSRSFDDEHELDLLADGRAQLFDFLDEEQKKKPHAAGDWKLGPKAGSYVITLDGVTETYTLKIVGGTGICLLVPGDPAAADLRRVWFAQSPLDAPDDDRERDPRGL